MQFKNRTHFFNRRTFFKVSYVLFHAHIELPYDLNEKQLK
jgi:hypothetical protein